MTAEKDRIFRDGGRNTGRETPRLATWKAGFLEFSHEIDDSSPRVTRARLLAHKPVMQRSVPGMVTLSRSFDPTPLRTAGEEAYRWACELFPINRSLTGNGVRQTLAYVNQLLPPLQLHQIASRTRVFDWTVPPEWEISEAYLEDERGHRVIDLAQNSLHVLGYSTPIDARLELDELEPHLFSLPDQPDAIPYVTSYYEPRWGFCLTHRVRETLAPGRYHAVIRARQFNGVLNYADLLIPGEHEDEILLSTYICHPSMANNELSGPVVTAALGRWLLALPQRRYTYRLVFAPETIGAIVYLSRNLERMKEKMRAGFVLSCVGDDRAYSYIASRHGNTLADRVARHVLTHYTSGFASYGFLERGSDERQYCSPGADLPVCSVLRTRHGRYPEYHTSLDNLDLISPSGLQGAIDIYAKMIWLLENNHYWKTRFPGEPQLGRHGLYPTLSRRGSSAEARPLRNVLAYADGTLDLIGLAETVDLDALAMLDSIAALAERGVIVRADLPHATAP
jgi:aminopeptidase-like protein